MRLKPYFIPAEGMCFVGGDYSQIELRVLAELSQDENMIDMLVRGIDIHKHTASVILGKPVEDITVNDRAIGKKVNFGMCYGISAYGLCETINKYVANQITLEDANLMKMRFYNNNPAPNRAKLVTYRCSTRQMKKGCDAKEIKRDIVEGFVIDQLQRYLLNDQLIPEITAQLNAYIKRNASNPQEVANYQVRLKELHHNKENLIDAISKTGLNDTFTQKLSEIETEMASIAALLNKSEKSQDMAVVTEEMVTQYIGSFKDYVLKRDKPQIKRMLANYVKRVDVFKDKITVTFKIAVPDALGNPVAISFEKEADKDSIRIA